MAARKKKLTQAQISEEVAKAARDYEHLANALWQAMLENTASRLGLETTEIEDDFGSLT